MYMYTYFHMVTKRIPHHSTNGSVLNSKLKQKKKFCFTLFHNARKLFLWVFPPFAFLFKTNNVTIICCIIVINLPDLFVFAIYYGGIFYRYIKILEKQKEHSAGTFYFSNICT